MEALCFNFAGCLFPGVEANPSRIGSPEVTVRLAVSGKSAPLRLRLVLPYP